MLNFLLIQSHFFFFLQQKPLIFFLFYSSVVPKWLYAFCLLMSNLPHQEWPLHCCLINGHLPYFDVCLISLKYRVLIIRKLHLNNWSLWCRLLIFLYYHDTILLMLALFIQYEIVVILVIAVIIVSREAIQIIWIQVCCRGFSARLISCSVCEVVASRALLC